MDKRDEGKLKSDLSHLAQLYIYSLRPSKKDIRAHKILSQLRRNRDIVFLRADKAIELFSLIRLIIIKVLLKSEVILLNLKNWPMIPLCREGKLQRFLATSKNIWST